MTMTDTELELLQLRHFANAMSMMEEVVFAPPVILSDEREDGL
jgi:hypothetical protein